MNLTSDQFRASIFNFPCNPTTAKRLRKQREKPVYGVGINDSWFVTERTLNGKQVQSPAYRDWKSMLTRCYSTKSLETYPTYKGCSVCKEWHSFMTFFAWWIQQGNTSGMQLDKDLLYPGNKIYSPDTCVFVPSHINQLLTDSAAARGRYPVGVCFDTAAGKLRAECRNGKKVHLGYFTDEETAHRHYLTYKAAIIQKYIFAGDLNPRILWGLKQHLSIAHGELEAYETLGPLIQSKALRNQLRAL